MAELRQQQKLFDQEVRDLQQIVDRKQAEIQSISSVILKVSYGSAQFMPVTNACGVRSEHKTASLDLCKNSEPRPKLEMKIKRESTPRFRRGKRPS